VIVILKTALFVCKYVMLLIVDYVALQRITATSFLFKAK